MSKRWARWAERLAVSSMLVALLTLAGPTVLAAQAADGRMPIVFVHGNGDSAAVWTTLIWRFESNGYPRDRLFAIDLGNPTARTDNAVPEPGRSSTEDVKDQLAAFVADVRRRTGAAKVALVGNSRGANTIRNYVKNGGGAAFVSKIVLGGGVNHGVLKSDVILRGSEFNGSGPFMRQLNAGPTETVPGVPFRTLRSGRLDKFAQPDGKYLGLPPGTPTGISYGAPALRGADNLVLELRDHREVSFHPDAFAPTYRFLTGAEPAQVAIELETAPVLDGVITGTLGQNYTNRPVSGASLAIYPVDGATGARLGPAARRVTTGADGRWGPFRAAAGTFYELVVTVPGMPITHIYRSPFARGGRYVTLRPAMASADQAQGSVVTMTRPRGYLGYDRDVVRLDGRRPAAIPNDPVPSVADATITVPFEPRRGVRARFNDERITVRNWPEGHVAIAEFHY